MKTFKLDLSVYDVEVPNAPGVTPEVRTEAYPIKDNYASWLRAAGVFRNGEEIAEAVHLAHLILQCEGDSLSIDERELEVLKKCLNRWIAIGADEHGNNNIVGGPIHEEAICRVFNLK
jgi:hypothetical protein